MPIQLFPVLVNFIVNARASTSKIVEFLGAVEVDNKRHHLQQVFVDFASLKQEAFEKCWAHSPLRDVLHCHSPGVATVTRRHCRKPPAHRCPRQRQCVTEGTAMAP